MNIDILRKNIEQVIMQPCFASPWNKANKSVKPNGLSENGTSICVKCKPDDTSSTIWIKYNDKEIDFIEEILERLPEKYRDHLVTLKHDTWISYSYEPVFDTDTQVIWDKELSDFMTAKQEWCDRYGCD